MRSAREVPAAGRRTLLRAVALVGAANLAGAVAVFAYATFLSPDPAATEADVTDRVVAFAVFVAVVYPLSALVAHLLLRRVVDWIRSGRAPEPADREAVLLAPLRLAVMAFAFWVLGAAVFFVLSLAGGPPTIEAARDAVTTLLGGLTAAMLSFLLVERELRPLLAVALAGDAPPRRRTLTIRARILVSWALGSGMPLAGIASAQLRPEGVEPVSPGAIAFLAASGLVAGGLMLAVAARSIAEPLRRVRRALRAVRGGDVSTTIAVDDGGEVGQLEAGFNEMVAGLRERQRLEDLFGRYVGPDVVAEALERGVELGGERREVTAMFVDLVGSTAMAHDSPPEEVIETLNAFFGAVVRATAAEGGWVDKFEGDGALCVFGAPVHQSDHAVRALRAARRLRAELVEVARDHPWLDAGIGVSSGTVVAGTVGATERFEYTVIGDPVNEAARLTDEAKGVPGRLLASAATLAAVAGTDEAGRWVPCGELVMRGRPAPTAVYAPVPSNVVG